VTRLQNFLNGVGVLAALLGFGLSVGAQASIWRYGRYLGDRIYNVNRWLRRNGAIAFVVGLGLMAIAALLSRF
jgi:hypothetical protein